MLGQRKNAAYAIAMTEENIYGIIRSEAGLGYDPENAMKWLKEFGQGWFLRDETTPLDCRFFVPETFDAMYKFVSNDQNQLMRQVEEI